LSASKYHWINYPPDKMTRVFHSQQAALRGVQEHELAQRLIKLGVKLPNNSQTLSLYVNDAIGFGMRPEQILFYSINCYGTADTICFDEKELFLRIHDLKTGLLEGSRHQLEIYMAIFCLEYDFNPTEIGAELRLYQNDDIQSFFPDPVDIMLIMDKIRTFNVLINQLREEAL
jgi:hypothetical protein